MSPTRPQTPAEAGPDAERSAAMRRVFVYTVAAAALCAVVWALIAGGDRDLSATAAAAFAVPAALPKQFL